MSINVTISKKIRLIHQHPLFSNLTSANTESLASHFSVENFSPGKTIVTEGELVDSIYFIVDGMVEVRHNVINKGIPTSVPVAILNPGEAIGLSESGLYTSIGNRTATVIALTDTCVLKLEIASFQQFISNNEHVNTEICESVSTLLRMNLIKRATPFSKLTFENLHWLAGQVKTVFFKAGETIFHAGEKGDHCYLLSKGKVEIFSCTSEGKEIIATLEPYSVFGEIALLMDLPRTASAVTLDDCELMTISRESLLQVVKVESDTAASLMKLLKKRSRPKQIAHIETHFIKTNDQKKAIILKDPQQWNYYQLTLREWFIWKLLDGRHSLHDIALIFNEKYKIFNPGMIATFIMDLDASGFIEKIAPQWGSEQAKLPLWLKSIMWIRQIFEASFSFGEADKWVTKTYNAGIYLIYTYTAQILLAIIGIAGFIVFLSQFNHHVEVFRITHHAGWLLFLAIFATMVGTLIHELAHAYTAKSFGRGVACFGVGWFWLGPMAFCDTSDMWLGSRRQRLAVDMAGLYCDFLLAGIASLAILFLKNSFIITFLWSFSLTFYLGIFYNLSPNIELDGYYILMDLTGKDNLREASIKWIAKPRFSWKYKVEISYWVICLIYLVLEVVIPYYVMKFLLYGLFGVSHPILSIMLPLIAVTLSSFSIWGEVKGKTHLRQK